LLLILSPWRNNLVSLLKSVISVLPGIGEIPTSFASQTVNIFILHPLTLF
jgi:hypothetical protein